MFLINNCVILNLKRLELNDLENLMSIIDFVLAILILLGLIKYFAIEIKGNKILKKDIQNIQSESRDVVLKKMKQDLFATHGLMKDIWIVYLCSFFILFILMFKSPLNFSMVDIFLQSLLIAAGVQSYFFLIKRDFNKFQSMILLRLFCAIIISCVVYRIMCLI